MYEPSNPPVIKTSSGIVHTGPCIFHGYLVGTDGTNDPTVTIYNNTAASGEEVIPTCSYSAAVLGVNGATGMKVYCDKGIYVEITCSGACEVVVLYSSGMYRRIIRGEKV